MCLTDLESKPLRFLKFRLFDESLLVAVGATNGKGCLERHGLPLGHYRLEIDGYDPLGAMLLDEDDNEPLNRTPIKRTD